VNADGVTRASRIRSGSAASLKVLELDIHPASPSNVDESLQAR
jgi:hypothetical protein